MVKNIAENTIRRYVGDKAIMTHSTSQRRDYYFSGLFESFCTDLRLRDFLMDEFPLSNLSKRMFVQILQHGSHFHKTDVDSLETFLLF